MKARTVVLCTALGAAVLVGCSADSRYRVLSFLFDGVPPPKAPETAVAEGTAPETRKIGYRGHGPYAARMCSACHESAERNALIAPREELCFHCHDMQLDKKYIHGPIASGGCTVCHDPHSSQYRYLLVSDSDTFCFYCHDRQTVERVAVHEGVGESCTSCHDPHMSDEKYLLK